MLLIARLAPILLLLLLWACPSDSGSSTPPPAEERVIRTSSAFLTWMSRGIAGDAVPVEYGLPADADPAHWTAEREAVRRFQSAALLVFNGAGYETWARHASLPGSRVVQTAEACEGQWIQREEKTHSHGNGPAHTHASIDPYVWLDPRLAALQAREIHAALMRRFPESSESFDRGLAEVLSALDEVEQGLSQIAPRLGDASVVAAHPSFTYLARKLDWKVTDLDISAQDAGALGPEIHAALDEARGEAERGLLLFDRPVSEAVRERCAEWSWQAVELDPLERLREGQDLPTRMAQNLQRLQQALD